MLTSKSPFVLFFVLLFAAAVSAQEIGYNRFSVEVSTGIHIPNSPKNDISNSDFVAFNQFQVAGRYMFSEKFGAKGHFAYNHFINSNNSNEGVGASRMGLEGVMNVGKVLNINYRIREKVGLLLHAGAGITFANPISEGGVERMGNLMGGLTAQVKLSKRFALMADATYVANLSQHYDFNGAALNPKTNSGGFLNVSLGLSYTFGTYGIHADWY